jgi:hypothetical protein
MDCALSRLALGVGLLFAVALANSSPAQEPAASAGASETLTLKERLGAKWTDEQRVDNCKVPLDKRGPKPRPDGCPTRPLGLSAQQR